MIEHIGLYVNDIESAKEFFVKYFGAEAGEMYHNPLKGFSSCFLSFGDGSRLELMTKTTLSDAGGKTGRYGYAHIAVSVGSKENVDAVTARIAEDGYEHVDGPRITGDGYYESVVLDAEGNVIEITV